MEGRSLSAVTHLARLGVNYAGTGILGLQKIKSSEKSLLYSNLCLQALCGGEKVKMREHKYEKYIYGGITAVLVIAVAILMIFFLSEINAVMRFVRKLLIILEPIIIGAVLTFLVAPIYNMTCRGTNRLLETNKNKTRKIGWQEKTVATIVSLIFLSIVIVSLFYLIIPQLYSSIVSIINNMSVYVQNINDWIGQIFEDNPELESEILTIYQEAVVRLQSWATTNLIPNLHNLEGLQNIGKVVGGVSSSVVGVINLAKNLLIGLIVMIYLLNIKDTLAKQAKRMIYAFLPKRVADGTVTEFGIIHQCFSGFIIGKIIDSLIIGVLCFILMKIFHLPFELLISVIVGVTNVIPFFGPFIGAIPSAILVFLISPMQCLYFVILILVLQQFDGNILGPKILGNSTGLSSFWVLFSILLFGGLFGFIGMIIAVPMTAVIFDLFKKLIEHCLRKKNLSTDVEAYGRKSQIDEENGK